MVVVLLNKLKRRLHRVRTTAARASVQEERIKDLVLALQEMRVVDTDEVAIGLEYAVVVLHRVQCYPVLLVGVEQHLVLLVQVRGH